AAADHIIENGIERELILACPLRNDLPDLGAVAAQKCGSRRQAAMPRLGGEDATKIAVVDLRIIDGVVCLLPLVVLGQGLRELAQRLRGAAAGGGGAPCGGFGP